MDPAQLPSHILDLLEHAEQLKLQGKYAEAIALLERLLLEDPTNVPALEEIADNELSCDRFVRAEVAARQALALDPLSYTAHYIIGFILSHQSKWEEARVHLKEANRTKPNNAEILRCLGWVLIRMKDRAQGLVTLERALNLDSENSLILCDLGVTYLEMKNVAKARALLQRALDIDPKSERARECLAMLERLQRTLDEGMKVA